MTNCDHDGNNYFTAFTHKNAFSKTQITQKLQKIILIKLQYIHVHVRCNMTFKNL